MPSCPSTPSHTCLLLLVVTLTGVFSDIHMLSLMYAGDMCYWMWKLSNPAPKTTPTISQPRPPTQQTKQKQATAKAKRSKRNPNKISNTPSSSLEAGSNLPVSGNSHTNPSPLAPPTLLTQQQPVALAVDHCKGTSTSNSDNQSNHDAVSSVSDSVSSRVSSSAPSSVSSSAQAPPTYDIISLSSSAKSPLTHMSSSTQSAEQAQISTLRADGDVGSESEATSPIKSIDLSTVSKPPSTSTIPVDVEKLEPVLPALPSASSLLQEKGLSVTADSPGTPSVDTGMPSVDARMPSVDAGRTLSADFGTLSVNPGTLSVGDTTPKLKDTDLGIPDIPMGKDERSEPVRDVASNLMMGSSLDFYHVMRHTCVGAESRWKEEFDPYKHGLEMLAKYIETARGPLKGMGWEYSRAVDIVVKLRKAAVAAAAAV